MNNDLIVVRQLPIIEDQLRQIKASVEERVNQALALACTEETRATVKAERAALNKEYAELETRRKEVKATILAPYEAFEALYKECAGDIYKNADAQLKARITEVEDGLRQQKADEVIAYFNEYRESIGIASDMVNFAMAGIRITMSESKKSLKAKAKDFLDRIAGDLAVIDVQEHKDEILVEYKRTLNVSQAITTVDQRLKAVEAERQRREELAAREAAKVAVQEKVEQIAMEETVAEPPEETPVSTPVVIEPSEVQSAETAPKQYSTAFRVTGTLDELKALKKFLTEGGYTYEQL